MGLVTKQLVAAHMTQLTDKNISVLAESKDNIVHCPSSNLKLTSGFSPIHKCHTYVR
jgi:5-methylthioadenosine/S-adenosylhomocysteine deaminase